jgi:D,D-heptose 1,7-bisphosphate phosphatase
MVEQKKAIFLDRDGVINKEVNYLSAPNEFELLDGTAQALKILKEQGFLLIVITNQSGLARGYFSEETLKEIHDKMTRLLKEEGVNLDDIFYCPHHPEFTGECSCRKPKPGMILEAQERYNIDLSHSYMIGDTPSDIKAGINAGCKTVFVLTGHGSESEAEIDTVAPDYIYPNLFEFAKSLE